MIMRAYPASGFCERRTGRLKILEETPTEWVSVMSDHPIELYGRACHDSLAPADIPRQIFEEFYAPRSDPDVTPRECQQVRSDRYRPLPARMARRKDQSTHVVGSVDNFAALREY